MISLNLAVTTTILADGSEDVSVAMRAIPTSINGSEVVQDQTNAQTYYRGHASEITDEAEAAKVAALVAAIKALVQE